MRINRRVFFLLITIIFYTFGLTACYNLGEGTQTDEEYRANYSLIRLVDTESDTYDYSMEDFYNDEAVNDLISPLSEDERREYTYIFVKSEKALSIGEIAIYFDSTVEADVNVKVFVMDEDDLPSDIYAGEDGDCSADECDEPDLADAVGDITFHVPGRADKWKEMYLRSWGKKEEAPQKRYTIGEDQYIVFRISNNCYDPAKRAFDVAEKTWQEALAVFEAAQTAYQAIMSDSSASASDKAAAQTTFNAASNVRSAAERDYNAAKAKYDSEKEPEYTRVPVRITAVLIYAD